MLQEKLPNYLTETRHPCFAWGLGRARTVGIVEDKDQLVIARMPLVPRRHHT